MINILTIIPILQKLNGKPLNSFSSQSSNDMSFDSKITNLSERIFL